METHTIEIGIGVNGKFRDVVKDCMVFDRTDGRVAVKDHRDGFCDVYQEKSVAMKIDRLTTAYGKVCVKVGMFRTHQVLGYSFEAVA